MSLIPEFIFRTAIVRGFRKLREDSRLSDQLFRNLDQNSTAEMRDFILKNRIYIDINYPRETLKLPAIVILLRSEEESIAFLNDSMGVDCVPDGLTYPDYEDSELDVLGGGNVGTMSGYGKTVFGPYPVVSSTNNTLKIASNQWAMDQYKIKNYQVKIVGGTGAGQVRSIVSNTQNTLMVASNWNTNPDNTSVLVVEEKDVQEIVGEPSSLYKRSKAKYIERLGSVYALNYQIQVIGSNSEQTIYLHAILKAILTAARTFLEGQGVINMKLGATDFVPRAEYQPDFAYMRALNVSFQYPFDIFIEMEGLAEAFNIVIEDKDENELNVITC